MLYISVCKPRIFKAFYKAKVGGLVYIKGYFTHNKCTLEININLFTININLSLKRINLFYTSNLHTVGSQPHPPSPNKERELKFLE